VKIAFAGGRGIPARYGGFETAVEEIGARLAERGHEVLVYSRAGYADGAGDSHRGMSRVETPYLRRQSLETLSHTFMSILRAARDRPDVLILVNPANGPLLLLTRALRIPCAINVDGLDWARSKWPPLGRRVIEFGAWCCAKLAPVVIADSHGIAEYYRRRWGREAYYASYGAEPWEFAPPRFLDEYSLTSREYALVVARLEPENNTELIIEAHRESGVDVPLVIVGDTHYESDYVRRLKSMAPPDRVRFLGLIYDPDRLRELLGHCAVYLHGHSVGGTNPILLEAMACGACIAYLDVTFNAEVCGEAGAPFAGDVETSARVIRESLSDDARAETLRRAARARQAERYTWDEAADRYEALCRLLIERRPRSDAAEA
jgi:glycosyltransferase involved in cell wall biosynthesis